MSATSCRVYVIGDSISIQYGPYLEAMLPARFGYSRKGGDEALRDLDRALGANGGDSSMVLRYLGELRQAGGLVADVLLLNCGLHDIKTDPATGQRQVALTDYEANLRQIIVQARAMAVEPVWVRTTPCDEAVHNARSASFHRFAADVVAYNAVADRVMDAAVVPVIDLFSFTTALGPELYCDHVHFLPVVRQAQAAYIAGWLSAYRR